MLTGHDARREDDLLFESDCPREGQRQMTLPILEEPAWLEDEELEEMDTPRDSAFRGIWIGIVAASVTFVLVFAVPHWLGWYDVGPPSQPAQREGSPESIIATVTAKPSGTAVPAKPPAPAVTESSTAAPPAGGPPATPPSVSLPKSAAPPDVGPSTAGPAASVPAAAVQKETKPAPAAKRTFTVQIAAFKDPKQASRLVARVKSAGYAAEARHLESAAVPWVVRVGTYPTREQAAAARDALARKGFRGFIL